MSNIEETGAAVQVVFNSGGQPPLGEQLAAVEARVGEMQAGFEAAAAGSTNEHAVRIRESLAFVAANIGPLVAAAQTAEVASDNLLASWGLGSNTPPAAPAQQALPERQRAVPTHFPILHGPIALRDEDE